MIGRRGFITGLENFDLFSMETYSADMAELSTQAASALNSQKLELQALQRMVWMLVQASGGTVKIPHNVLSDYRANAAKIETAHMVDDMSIVVTAR